MEKFKYQAVELSTACLDRLNERLAELGNQGYDFVTLLPARRPDAPVVGLFKRTITAEGNGGWQPA